MFTNVSQSCAECVLFENINGGDVQRKEKLKIEPFPIAYFIIKVCSTT